MLLLPHLIWFLKVGAGGRGGEEGGVWKREGVEEGGVRKREGWGMVALHNGGIFLLMAFNQKKFF